MTPVSLLLLLLLPLAASLIHSLRVTDDDRNRFFIESFGFSAGGHLVLEVSNFRVAGQPYKPTVEGKKEVGFLIKRTDVDSTAFLEENAQVPCLLDAATDRDLVVPLTSDHSIRRDHLIEAGAEGFYSTYFISCIDAPVSFNLRLTQYNVNAGGERSYLSAGRAPLPALFGVLTGTYLALLIFWFVAYIQRSPAHVVHRVHHLMTLLVLLKMLAMFFKTIDYHVKETTGSAHGWGVVYFLFAGAKGLLMFVLIALIGTGWKFIKPFLQDKDKRIFMIVIPLQLLDNIALIVIEEASPGSQAFFGWKDLFRLVDLICAGAVLLPIIWSINHLREAAQIDGKAQRNLSKLKLFRQFYLLTISMIYASRVLVFLLEATLPLRFVWAGNLCAEAVNLGYFVLVGYLFKPQEENPYLHLEPHETDDEGGGGDGDGGGVKMEQVKKTTGMQQVRKGVEV